MQLEITTAQSIRLSLTARTATEFLYLASRALHSLRWEQTYVQTNGIIAKIPPIGLTLGGEIRLELHGTHAILLVYTPLGQRMPVATMQEIAQKWVDAMQRTASFYLPEEVDYTAFEAKFAPYQDFPEDAPISAKAALQNIIPRLQKGFFITPILLLAHVVYYLVMAVHTRALSFNDPQLLECGAHDIAHPLSKSLLTHSLVHFDTLHWGMDLYALFFMGLQLEPLLGKRRMFFLCLFLGTIPALGAHLTETPLIYGATGAAWGMLAASLLFLLTRTKPDIRPLRLLVMLSPYLAYSLVLAILGTQGQSIGVIFAGLVCGLALAAVWVPGLKKRQNI